MSDSSALSVVPGVECPPTVNPRLRASARPPVSIEALVNGIHRGERGTLSRAITLVESTRPDHEILSRELIERILPHSGRSVRLGITGVPGVGKSTFIEALGTRVLDAEPTRKLAVLAIDPTSAISGGSVLGDKSRMAVLSAHPRAFIRPSPTGGTLGGVARKTREAILLCEAAGYDTMFVETVGVGQSELMVHSMVDCFLLLMLAGAGDELQGIKRGIVEMADLVAITKADGDNLVRAKVARQQAINALHLFPPSPSDWRPPVELCSSVAGSGLLELFARVLEFAEHERKAGWFDRRRADQRVQWFRQMVDEELHRRFAAQPGLKDRLTFLEDRVATATASPRVAVSALFTDP